MSCLTQLVWWPCCLWLHTHMQEDGTCITICIHFMIRVKKTSLLLKQNFDLSVVNMLVCVIRRHQTKHWWLILAGRHKADRFFSSQKSFTVGGSLDGTLELPSKPAVKGIWCQKGPFVHLYDSRLTFHLITLLSCRPSLLFSSSRITSSFWIWAEVVRAISSTGKCTPANLAAETRTSSFVSYNTCNFQV